MDPNAALAKLLDELNEHEFMDAFHTAGDLAQWLDKGGFMPDIDRAMFRGILRHVMNAAFMSASQ